MINLLNNHPLLKAFELDQDLAVNYHDIDYLPLKEDRKNIKKDLQNIKNDLKKIIKQKK